MLTKKKSLPCLIQFANDFGHNLYSFLYDIHNILHGTSLCGKAIVLSKYGEQSTLVQSR